MLTTGNILMPQMRNPVASSNKPPTALKSAIIDGVGNDSNLLIVFYVQIMPDDFVMQLHRF